MAEASGPVDSEHDLTISLERPHPTVALLTAAPLAPLRSIALPKIEPISSTQSAAAAGIMLAAGALLAMLTTPDPLWWQLHFSQLGTFPVFSGYVFNAGVVASSALLVLLAARLRCEMLRHVGTSVLTNRRAAFIVPLLIALIGVHLSIIGFVPLSTSVFIHERGSSGAVLAFAAALLSSRWTLRGMHGCVARTTRRVGIALVVGAVPFATGVINLALFELIVFSLMFVWLVTITRNVGRATLIEVAAPSEATEADARTAPRRDDAASRAAPSALPAAAPAMSAQRRHLAPLRLSGRAAHGASEARPQTTNEPIERRLHSSMIRRSGPPQRRVPIHHLSASRSSSWLGRRRRLTASLPDARVHLQRGYTE